MCKLILDDSRRLTGKSMVWDYPGAILDTFVSGIDKQQVVECWQQNIQTILQAVGWLKEKTSHRIFADGISFLLSAPLDCLYAATEINEAAWDLCCAKLQNKVMHESSKKLIERLKKLIHVESNPQLLNFISQAEAAKVPWLLDDDEITLGYGASSQTWPFDKLPEVSSINWSQYYTVPIAMITGTNGKSTSVRLTAEMIKMAGKSCGVTSTDFIKVGDEVLEKGDYSGPGGARILLKHHQTEMALLEVARGGLLRRGLAVPHADAALITNIAEDHLGQYGITNLDELTQAKCIVAKALTTGPLILNADDKQLSKIAGALNQNIIWFSLHKNNPLLLEQQKKQMDCCYIDHGQMIYQQSNKVIEVIAIDQVPMTFKGAAIHNIQNALGAIALARALNINWRSIRKALRSFNSDAADNPGRGNQFAYHGATVIVDFAHNPHSMQAMAEMVKNMPASRKILLLSGAGDRSDLDLQNMTVAALKMEPSLMYIAEVVEYLRGRKLTEVPAIMMDKAMGSGLTKDMIQVFDDPLLGTQAILRQIKKGDLVLIMALTHRQQIFNLLNLP